MLSNKIAPSGVACARERLLAVFERNEVVLVKWLTSFLKDRDRATDIAQDTFLKIWKYSGANIVESPKALIFTTAGNLAKNELRRRNRVLPHGALSGEQIDIGPLREVVSEEMTPEESVVYRQQVEQVLRAIDQLPRKQRQALKLNRFSGLKYYEIAQIMQVSDSSVEKYISEALKNLRYLKDNGGWVS